MTTQIYKNVVDRLRFMGADLGGGRAHWYLVAKSGSQTCPGFFYYVTPEKAAERKIFQDCFKSEALDKIILRYPPECVLSHIFSYICMS